jgi:outer membrane immunogenic protein
MIRHLLSSTALATLLVGGPALAADVKMKTPVFTKAPVVPVFSWTGFYIGANAGGHWGHDTVTTTSSTLDGLTAAGAAAIDAASPTTLNPAGVIAGGQIGFNLQVNHAVLGIEADADWEGGSASRTLMLAAPPAVIAGDRLTDTTQGQFLGTIRPRLGVAFDRALLYATAGLAVGSVKTTDQAMVAGGAVLEQISASTTRYGYVYGGGFEYAFVDNWSFKAEGLHVELGGTYDVGIPCVAACAAAAPPDIAVHHRYTDNIARVGLNYRFGMAPVMTKY